MRRRRRPEAEAVPTILITGTNRGIGLELTRSFAKDGWRVHACCRDLDRAKDLRAVDGAVEMHKLDVTDGARVAVLARELDGEAIDILFNNAGVYGPRAGSGKTEYEAWAPVFSVNAFAPLRLAESFAAHVARSERKLILNMSSAMGSIAECGGGSVIYRSSKAALNMISKTLSVDLAGQGITVVAFHPGWVQTDMGGRGAAITPEVSVRGLRRVIAGLTSKDTGGFFTYDGRKLPW
jgi:NAD(P)-dependent dehydrogenase (short-subunit alcohol dehydrogenase family)